MVASTGGGDEVVEDKYVDADQLAGELDPGWVDVWHHGEVRGEHVG